MEQSQIRLIQESFAHIAPHADLVTDLFFARLFQLEPTLRTHFPNDLRAPKGQFMYALTRVVRDLNVSYPETESEHARRHVVGAALLWTMEQGLGEQFTGEVRMAWTEFCPQLAVLLPLIQHIA